MRSSSGLSVLFVLALGALAPAPVPAAEGPLAFLDGPAGHIATDDEKKAWKDVKDEKGAAAFIDLFWVRRDPTPGTPKNEFREDYDRRIEAADKRADVGGSKTDRGMVFVLMGLPSAAQTLPLQEWLEKLGKVETVAGGGRSGGASGAAGGGSEPPILSQFKKGSVTIWLYRKDKLPAGFPDSELRVAFVTEEGVGENQLQRDPKVLQALEIQKKSDLKSPDLQALPDWAKAVPPAAEAPPPAAALPEPFAGTIAAMFGAEPAGMAEKAKSFNYSSFKKSGRPFTSLLLVVAKKDAEGKDLIPPGVPVKFVGEVRDSAGTAVARFAVDSTPEMPIDQKDELSFGESVWLRAGDYSYALAVVSADGASTLAARIGKLTVPDFTTTALVVSDLMITKEFDALQKAQAEDQPFCFGGVRVIPTGVVPFNPTDSIWYFFTVSGVSVDPATQQPMIQTGVVIKEEGSNKPRVRTQPADAIASAIADGRYGIGQEIPLSQLPFLTNGNWRFEIEVVDKLADKRQRIGGDFRFAGGKDPEKPVDPKAPKGKKGKK